MKKATSITVKFIKVDIKFPNFTSTVSYNADTKLTSVLSTYDKTNKRINVSTEMLAQIEEALFDIIKQE